MSSLKKGFYVDYDGKTWKVVDTFRYDFGEGFFSDKWELTCKGSIVYLERTESDTIEWVIYHKFSLNLIEGNIRDYMLRYMDPPERLLIGDRIFNLQDAGDVYVYREGAGKASEYSYWNFVDEEGDSYFSIEQQGEKKYNSFLGFKEEEDHFTNIRPGKKTISIVSGK